MASPNVGVTRTWEDVLAKAAKTKPRSRREMTDEEILEDMDRVYAREASVEDARLEKAQTERDDAAVERSWYRPLVEKWKSESRIERIRSLEAEQAEVLKTIARFPVKLANRSESFDLLEFFKPLVSTQWQASVLAVRKTTLEAVPCGESNVEELKARFARLVEIKSTIEEIAAERLDWEELIFTAPQKRCALFYAKQERKSAKGPALNMIEDDILAINRMCLPEDALENVLITVHDYCPPLSRTDPLENGLKVYQKTAAKRAEQERTAVQVEATKRSRDALGHVRR